VRRALLGLFSGQVQVLRWEALPGRDHTLSRTERQANVSIGRPRIIQDLAHL
jgi:hypothetical protein